VSILVQYLSLELSQQALVLDFKLLDMKNKILIKRIILILITVVSVNSCSLDEELFGVASSKDFIQNEEDASYVVYGVYASLQHFSAFKSSLGNILFYSGDEFAYNGFVGSNTAGIWLNRLYTATDPYISNSWQSFYRVINRANSAIEAIDPVTSINPMTRAKINGEMTFLRGFAYYNLVRLFGEVIIRTNASNPTHELKMSRQPVDSVYAQIFRDFKNANQKCLPYSKQPSSEFGRVTKGAAQAMLSHAYLTYANYCDLHDEKEKAKIFYQYAVDWSDSVLISNEYELIADFAELFDVNKERDAYKEVIFGIQLTRDVLTSGAGAYGSEWAYYLQPRERWGVTGFPITGEGQGRTYLQPWFAEQYFTGEYAGDYRSEFSILTDWEGFTTAGVPKRYITFPKIYDEGDTPDPDIIRKQMPYCNKYIDAKGLDARNHENDLFVIRLAEIYLIKAEALNELGFQSEAYEVFNAIRARARQANGVTRSTPVDLNPYLDKEEFRLAVYNERGIELLGEAQRYYDGLRMRYPYTNTPILKWRMETFYPNMSAEQKTLPTWNASEKKWVGGRVYAPSIITWHDRFLLLPIPANEVDANPNVGLQNVGW
jgi:hypothetical protein